MKKIFVILWVYVITACLGADQQSCCQKENFKQRCHFLCNGADSSFLDELACAAERIKLLQCKTQEKFDLAKLYGNRFTDTVSDAWENLTNDLKSKLSDVKKFTSVQISELRKLHQDMLSSLSTLSAMTASQFGGIMDRFADFTSDNLKNLINNVDINVLYSKMTSLASYAWDKSQLATLADTAYKKFGPKVQEWSADNLKSLGKILSGLSTKIFSQFSEEAFQNSLDKICEASVSLEKKVKMLPIAEKVFGKQTSWNSSTIDRLCNLVEALSPKEFLMMKAKEIEDSISTLSKRFLTPEQKEAIVTKLKEQWGKVSQWTVENFKKAKNLVEGLSAEDFQDLNKEKIMVLLESGKVKLLNKVQQSALYKKLIEEYGQPEDWPESVLTKAVDIVDSLSVEDLEKIKQKAKSSLIKALKAAQNVEWSRDQAEFLLKLLEDENALATFTKDQIVKLGSFLKAFSKSEAGQLSQKVLFLAFPELVFVKGIGEPVIRHFIKVYKAESKNGEIKSLGQFAKALTRHEVSQENIQNILANLEELTGTDFNEAQAAELMIKVRKVLGNISRSDHTNADIAPWGFQNLRKIGKVILSLSRKEAENFPFKGVDDTYEELGKHDDWKRRMVIAFLQRIKTSWKEQDMDMKDLKEVNIDVLGKFVQGFTISELDRLSEDVKLMAIKKLGEHTGLPEDKLKTRANYAYNFFEKVRSGGVTANDWKTMGSLLAGLSPELINKMLPEDVVNNIEKLIDGAPVQNLDTILRKVKEHLKQSDVAKWTASQWEKSLPLVRKLTSTIELKLMNNDVFKQMLGELGEITTWSNEQVAVLLQKAKSTFGEDISKWEAKVIHQMGSIMAALSEQDVSKLTKQFFDNLNSDLLDGKNISVTLKKLLASKFIKEYLNNDASKLTAKLMRRFHYLLGGLDLEQLKKINIDGDDLLDAITSKDDWTVDQLKVLEGKALGYIRSDLYEVDERSNYIKNLVKAFSTDDIQKIPKTAFLNSLGTFGSFPDLTKEQKDEMVKKMKSYWGDISKWGAGQITDVRNLIDGMNADDIKKINPDHVNRIGTSSIKVFSNEQVKALTVEQLLEFDEEQIKAFTPQQRSSFNQPQASALRTVENEDPKEADPYQSAGSQNKFCMMTLVISSVFMVFMTWY